MAGLEISKNSSQTAAPPQPEIALSGTCELIARVVSKPERIIKALDEPRLAGLHKLHESPGLTILNVVWVP